MATEDCGVCGWFDSFRILAFIGGAHGPRPVRWFNPDTFIARYAGKESLVKIFFYGVAFVLAILGIYVASNHLSQWWSETITGWSFVIFVLVGISSGRGIVRTIKKSVKAKRKAKAKEEKSKGNDPTVSKVGGE